MEEIIKKITENIWRYYDMKKKKTFMPNEVDIAEMLTTVKHLITLKDEEISYLNKMLCVSAHSLTNFGTFNMIDSAISKAKKESEQLEKLKIALNSLMIWEKF